MIPVAARLDNEPPTVSCVRRAARADAAALARLRYDFRAPLGETVELEGEFLERCESWMQARLHAESVWRVWIAEAGANAVGCVWLQLIEKLPNPVAEAERHAYVSNLFVRDDVRGQGVGSQLLRAALDECDRLDVDDVILWPTPRSRSLYLRHGFTAADNMLVLRRAGES